MKKISAILFILLIGWGLFQPALVLAEEGKLASGLERSQVGQKIEDFVREHEKTTAGMATAVFDKDGSIYQGSFGYMDKEKGVKADDDSVFEWGSVSKLAVWISAMQLWEEGQLDLEADIKTYLPDGFLKHLSYDKAITMLDLMNHQAGFDETPMSTEKGKTFEELLSDYQPPQSFEPGTTTAYSNFSTALASYIVERLSGQTFANYVHQHIFKPLEMERTAILPDQSDNDFVKEKLRTAKSYTRDGQLLGNIPYETALYSVGGIAGSLSDFQKFGQALLSRKTLFARAETWTTLYTGTSAYPGTDLVRNAHGFWGEEYAVSILGHGGNTDGFSSRLMLDLENGLGFVVMTNQASEVHYNTELPKLFFGQAKEASQATQEQFSPGYYRVARGFSKGPLSIAQLIPGYTMNLQSAADLKGAFWTASKNKGQDRISTSVSDFEKISDHEIMRNYIVAGLGGVAILYALVAIVMGLLAALVRLLSRKKSRTSRSWKIWNYLTLLGVAAVALNLAMIIAVFDYSSVQGWRYLVFAALAVFLTVAGLWPLFRKSQEKFSKGQLFLTLLTSLSALALAGNIFYWSLYQWWLL